MANSNKVKDWWVNTTSNQKIFIGLAACLFLAAVLFGSIGSIGHEYRVLFHGLEAEDASQIVELLKQDGIPYKLALSGKSILVPDDKVYDTRLKLAGKGFPKSKIVGFEIFDQTSLGTTEFVQQLNYTRALQGELSRTITHMNQIKRAVVHIARPKPSIFNRKTKLATASVMLELKPGYLLTKLQITGIAFLVASAVEGLDVERVSILDQKGRLLSSKHMAGMDPAIGSAIELQRNAEEYLKNKAQSMLDQILGIGKAVVRVHLEMDFTKSKEIKEIYNPESQTVKSETIRTHKNQESYPRGGTSSKSKIRKRRVTRKVKEEKQEDREVQYAVDKTIKEIQNKIGKIKKLSLALVLDIKLAKEADRIGSLIKKTIGFDEARGDKFEVTAITFHKEDIKTEPIPFWQKNYKLISLVMRQGVIALAIIIFGVVLVVLLKKSEPVEKIVERAPTPEEILANQQEKKSETTPENRSNLIIQNVREISRKNTEGAAAILRQWFHEED